VEAVDDGHDLQLALANDEVALAMGDSRRTWGYVAMQSAKCTLRPNEHSLDRDHVPTMINPVSSINALARIF